MKSTLCFLTVMLCLTQVVLSYPAVYEPLQIAAPALRVRAVPALEAAEPLLRQRRHVYSQFVPYEPLQIAAPALRVRAVPALEAAEPLLRQRRDVYSQFVPYEPLQIAAPALRVRAVPALEAAEPLLRQRRDAYSQFVPYEPLQIAAPVPAIAVPVAQSRLKRGLSLPAASYEAKAAPALRAQDVPVDAHQRLRRDLYAPYEPKQIVATPADVPVAYFVGHSGMFEPSNVAI